MAGLPDGFAMLPEGQEPVVSGVTFAAQARPSRQPQSVPKPSAAASPTSPPDTMPTGTAGQPSAATTTEAMETDNEQPDDTMGASAQSISSGSRTASSLANTIVADIKSMMWEAIASRQCAPMVMDMLLATEYVPQDDTTGNNDR
eukprot:1417985-Amphidinium_carterae.1